MQLTALSNSLDRQKHPGGRRLSCCCLTIFICKTDRTTRKKKIRVNEGGSSRDKGPGTKVRHKRSLWNVTQFVRNILIRKVEIG